LRRGRIGGGGCSGEKNWWRGGGEERREKKVGGGGGKKKTEGIGRAYREFKKKQGKGRHPGLDWLW